MSISPDSPEAQAAVQSQLGAQATTVGGTDVAGIYGDPAGASRSAPAQSPEQVAQNLVSQGAQPAAPDVGALLERIQALEAQQAAEAASKAKAEADAAPKPPVLEEITAALSGVAPGIVHAFMVIAARLEGK